MQQTTARPKKDSQPRPHFNGSYDFIRSARKKNHFIMHKNGYVAFPYYNKERWHGGEICDLFST
jgi:hypothetical protein